MIDGDQAAPGAGGAPRLAHGYTNATSTDGRTVTKRYLGPDAARRQGSEVAALCALAGHLSVPALVERGQGWIRTALMPGVHGQELLATAPRAVLATIGRTARQLHEITPAALPGWAHPHDGGVLVHGDFGPQNVLLDADTAEVTAVLDWELAHLGDPVEDLAWAEWIVRTHHRDAVRHLPALFEGYGQRPPWERRRAVAAQVGRRAAHSGRRMAMTTASMRWSSKTKASRRTPSTVKPARR